jgi:hypothetical protein
MRKHAVERQDVIVKYVQKGNYEAPHIDWKKQQKKTIENETCVGQPCGRAHGHDKIADACGAAAAHGNLQQIGVNGEVECIA